MKPFWITFYSYKGGVGRSLALANTAALLAKRGRSIVLIDFDLEAPGLDSFEEFSSVAGKPGVVEYVAQFKETNRAPDITQFVHPCELPGPLRGRLWIMPAGKKDASYNASRADLSWADIYENHHGEEFVENWKAALENHYHPDYVFVDSRTGLTEVGGICTLHLPDLVVMFFGLNEQNVRGVAAVAKTIRESERSKLPQIHYVASPVPNLPRDKKGPLVERLTAVTEHLGAKIESSIRYQPLAALTERLFVLDPDLAPSAFSPDYQETLDPERRFLAFSRFPIVQDYGDLLDRLINYNRSGLDFLVRQVKIAIAEGDAPLMDRLFDLLRDEYSDRPEALMARANLRQASSDYASAITLAHRALDLDPAFTAAFEWLIKQYKRDGKFSAALKLCNDVLASSERLDPATLSSVHQQRGETAMASGEYEQAGYSFAHSLEREVEGDHPDPTSILIHSFNRAEAIRRLVREPRPEVWRPIVDLFDKTGETASAPLIWQANRFQAIHIAFAMVGDTLRARETLIKARTAAELLGPAEDTFTVKTYTNVPVKEFLAINQEMLAALDRGELWDGMPLSPPPPPQASSDSSGLTSQSEPKKPRTRRPRKTIPRDQGPQTRKPE